MSGQKTGHDRAPLFVRIANRLIGSLLRAGFPMGPMILLTVRGRKSGLLRTTPVNLFEVNSHRYLFSTFGEVHWVHNLRANGEGILSHGRHKEAVNAIEMAPDEAAPVLKGGLSPFLRWPLARDMLRVFYGVTPDTPTQGFVDVARHHPVFALKDS